MCLVSPFSMSARFNILSAGRYFYAFPYKVKILTPALMANYLCETRFKKLKRSSTSVNPSSSYNVLKKLPHKCCI